MQSQLEGRKQLQVAAICKAYALHMTTDHVSINSTFDWKVCTMQRCSWYCSTQAQCLMAGTKGLSAPSNTGASRPSGKGAFYRTKYAVGRPLACSAGRAQAMHKGPLHSTTSSTRRASSPLCNGIPSVKYTCTVTVHELFDLSRSFQVLPV